MKVAIRLTYVVFIHLAFALTFPNLDGVRYPFLSAGSTEERLLL